YPLFTFIHNHHRIVTGETSPPLNGFPFVLTPTLPVWFPYNKDSIHTVSSQGKSIRQSYQHTGYTVVKWNRRRRKRRRGGEGGGGKRRGRREEEEEKEEEEEAQSTMTTKPNDKAGWKIEYDQTPYVPASVLSSLCTLNLAGN
ncbi:hypothetical protein STEG23_032135, partial [Scotinomys teguina]